MKSYAGYVVAVLVGIAIGYFGGREHLKYEMQSALRSAAGEFQRGLSSAFGDGSESRQQRAVVDIERQREQELEDSIKTAYIADHLELYDLSARYKVSRLDGNIPGVLFKIRNNGQRSLDRVEVTVYFKDTSGAVIAEESYLPVLVSAYSLSGDNRPLRPGYIWQMEQGKFYAGGRVPSEWEEGSVDAVITDIRFSE